MKCISIKQPWAWFIVNGHKPVENRSWPSKYRGELLIHASKTFDWDGWEYLCEAPIYGHYVEIFKEYLSKQTDVPTGILGKVNMVDCVEEYPSIFFFGPYGFIFKDPEALSEPIPYKGKLGIFDVPDDILKQVI